MFLFHILSDDLLIYNAQVFIPQESEALYHHHHSLLTSYWARIISPLFTLHLPKIHFSCLTLIYFTPSIYLYSNLPFSSRQDKSQLFCHSAQRSNNRVCRHNLLSWNYMACWILGLKVWTPSRKSWKTHKEVISSLCLQNSGSFPWG